MIINGQNYAVRQWNAKHVPRGNRRNEINAMKKHYIDRHTSISGIPCAK